MQTEHPNTAHSLYALYETLPGPIQQAFLQELMEKQKERLEELAFDLACQQAKEENEFLSKGEALGFIKTL